MEEENKTPQEQLRDLADRIDIVERKYGLECGRIWGLGEMARHDLRFGAVIDNKKLWDALPDNDNVFIGMSYNDNRPEIRIRTSVEGIGIELYSFKSMGSNNCDGGFLSAYPTMMEKLKKAPDFIKERVKKFYEQCRAENKKEKLESELAENETRSSEIKKELQSYP